MSKRRTAHTHKPTGKVVTCPVCHQKRTVPKNQKPGRLKTIANFILGVLAVIGLVALLFLVIYYFGA